MDVASVVSFACAKMNVELGESDYRVGGLERLREAWVLWERGFYAGSVYLAGRSVESLFRAVIWKYDTDIRTGKKALETGHDLRQMLKELVALGVLNRQSHANELMSHVQLVSRLWYNNMRFVPTAKMKTLWWGLGEIGPRRTIKFATREYFDACSAIVKRCEALCVS